MFTILRCEQHDIAVGTLMRPLITNCVYECCRTQTLASFSVFLSCTRAIIYLDSISDIINFNIGNWVLLARHTSICFNALESI